MPIRKKKINDAEENVDINSKNENTDIDDSEYKQCPFCANKIRKGAIKCQYCHESLGNNEKINNPGINIEIKKDSHKGIIVLLVSIIIILFMVLIWYIFNGEGEKYDVANSSSVSYLDDDNNSIDVIDYNDALVDAATECIGSEDAVWSAYDDDSSSVEDIQLVVNNMISQCRAAITKVKDLGDFDGDNELNKGVLNVLEKEVAYYSKFNELLPYIDNDSNNMYDKLFDELQEIDTQLSEANDELITIQERFSERHGFELEDS